MPRAMWKDHAVFDKTMPKAAEFLTLDGIYRPSHL